MALPSKSPSRRKVSEWQDIMNEKVTEATRAKDAELEAVRAELAAVRGELAAVREAQDQVVNAKVAEATRAKDAVLEAVRGELAAVRGELAAVRGQLTAANDSVVDARASRDAIRQLLKTVLEKCGSGPQLQTAILRRRLEIALLRKYRSKYLMTIKRA